MKYHPTAASLLSFAEDMGFAVCDIPEGMDPVGALVVVITRRRGGKADEVEVGTITADDIKGTGPFLAFTPDGSLLGAGLTADDAFMAISAAWSEEMEEQRAEAQQLAPIPFH